MISRTGSHALKALTILSGLAFGSYAGAAQMARQIKAPSNYLGKILRQLSRAGVVEGRKGLNGGFRLARNSRSISLYDVLEPIEHVAKVKGCILGKQKCFNSRPCALHKGWSVVREQYLDFLQSTTLADLDAT